MVTEQERFRSLDHDDQGRLVENVLERRLRVSANQRESRRCGRIDAVSFRLRIRVGMDGVANGFDHLKPANTRTATRIAPIGGSGKQREVPCIDRLVSNP